MAPSPGKALPLLSMKLLPVLPDMCGSLGHSPHLGSGGCCSWVQGSEQRDMLLGQVFGLGSLVRSGMSIDAECACAVAASLVSVAEKKSFLREVSGGWGAACSCEAGRATSPAAGCASW